MQQLLHQALQSPPFQSFFSNAGEKDLAHPVSISGIDSPGTPFAIAVIAKFIQSRNPQARLWTVCGNPRLLDAIEAELTVWETPATHIPEAEISYDINILPDPDVVAERLAVIQRLQTANLSPESQVIILSETDLDESVPAPGTLQREELRISQGARLNHADFITRLEEASFEKSFQVNERAQFAVRGGIVDVFSRGAELPIRIEFFDDEVESIRSFNIHTQLTEEQLSETGILLSIPEKQADLCKLRDYMGEDDVVLAIDCPDEVQAHIRISNNAPEAAIDAGIYDCPLGVFDPGDFVQQDARRQAFTSQVAEWYHSGWTVTMCFHSEGEVERFRELIGSEIIDTGHLQVALAPLPRGFTMPDAKLAILSDAEVFGRYQTSRVRSSFRRENQLRQTRASTEIRELTEGDLVVHAEYGIGQFLGLHPEPGENNDAQDEDGREVIWIAFANEAKLYVPLDQAHLVSRYVGSGRASPKLSTLGSIRWSKLKADTEKAIEDYAARLLAIQAERETRKGYAHPPDGHWQFEFENSFPYRETPDQLRAIAETKQDMERHESMDRLICGDVGFGKTEVAIRAAFKSVVGGRQVAILVPTTVLAQQHYQTFRERMSDYPITVDLLSRYRSPAEQRNTIHSVADGSVDIVIGTHRLIGKDVSFKNLGLIIIDEEQRFGVKHKERFKEMFRQIDVLTLSATPIPRTLYLSLMGARSMSTIDTPPPNRYPVKTNITPYDERTIKTAIQQEIQRGGQVFFLHNRVKTINAVAQRLEDLCPDATTIVGHGQMEEGVLEEVMRRFVGGEVDVLVSTTIIESGIDIPNANTIIIDRADRFGLADLYQLRGRVGRGGIRAHAFLLLPQNLMGTGDARKRLNAIRQYSDLGAGFRIAMRDLEIRGAGNLLGIKQSGHIAAVGFDMYCKLLRESVDHLAGRRATPPLAATALYADFLSLSETTFTRGDCGLVPAFIPASYMAEARLRIAAYRSLAELRNIAELSLLAEGWRDRFGRPPEAVENLLTATELKLVAAAARIQNVEIRKRQLRLTRNGKPVQIEGKFPRLTAHKDRDCLKEALDLIKTTWH